MALFIEQEGLRLCLATLRPGRSADCLEAAMRCVTAAVGSGSGCTVASELEGTIMLGNLV